MIFISRNGHPIKADNDNRGIVNMFGAFQTFYENDLLSHESPSNISWIGSIQAFLLLLVGVFTGPLFGNSSPLISLKITNY